MHATSFDAFERSQTDAKRAIRAIAGGVALAVFDVCCGVGLYYYCVLHVLVVNSGRREMSSKASTKDFEKLVRDSQALVMDIDASGGPVLQRNLGMSFSADMLMCCAVATGCGL